MRAALPQGRKALSVTFGIDQESFEKLEEAAKDFNGNAGDVISDVFHDSGADIYQHINALIHPSGRRFKGHQASATSSAWPRFDTNEPLSITVATKTKWHYLYFPDDGSNTDHHAGMQRFFKRGAEAAAPRIIDRCLGALIAKWKE